MSENMVIIDTDIGDDIDDAFAIALAAAMPEINLVGITTVFCNTVKRAQQVKELLSACGKDIPVFAGEGKPYMKPYHPVGEYSDEDIMKGTPCQWSEDYAKYKIEDGAVDFLIEQAEKYGKKLTIVPIGPLTNIARAIEKAPQSMKKISKIVLMGGYFSKTDPEWNILVDPKAAEIVFNSGIELYVVGLDVTLQCTLKEDLLKDFRNSSKAVNKVLTLWLDRWFKRYGLGKSVMHDPLAIASLNGDVCVFEKKFVKVLLEGKRGTTLVSDKKEEGFSPVFVAVSVNSEKFYSLVRQYLL